MGQKMPHLYFWKKFHYFLLNTILDVEQAIGINKSFWILLHAPEKWCFFTAWLNLGLADGSVVIYLFR